jgi:DNA-binding transcriptional MerR regulator
MADDANHSVLIAIGALARLTGLSVRTLRFYSDSGLLAPAGRSEAGYRLYDAGAAPRAELVRTLRELGVDLPTIRRVLDRELGVADVARAHAAAVDAQIRVLRLQRAVLAAAAARMSTTPQEMKLMHDLARLSAAERRSIVTDFVDDVFDGLDADPGIVERMRMAMPELPDEPTTEQVQAWIELAELVGDPDFRGRVRAMAQRSSDDRAAGGSVAVRAATDSPAGGSERERHGAAHQAVVKAAGAAAEAGIDPASPAAREILAGLVPRMAELYGTTDGPQFRVQLGEMIGTFTDRRVERYWQLLAIINGWPQRGPSSTPAWEWLLAALRAAG